jgi:hypothetical protein
MVALPLVVVVVVGGWLVGGAVTIVGVLVMLFLFVSEFSSYTQVVTEGTSDSSSYSSYSSSSSSSYD